MRSAALRTGRECGEVDPKENNLSPCLIDFLLAITDLWVSSLLHRVYENLMAPGQCLLWVQLAVFNPKSHYTLGIFPAILSCVCEVFPKLEIILCIPHSLRWGPLPGHFFVLTWSITNSVEIISVCETCSLMPHHPKIDCEIHIKSLCIINRDFDCK